MEDREYELMLENQKLKLENSDLINSKERQRKTFSDTEIRVKKYQDDLQQCREQNSTLKAELVQAKKQQESAVIDLEKELSTLKLKYADLKQENDKFRSFMTERTQSHIDESEDYLQHSVARDEARRQRVSRLLDYKAHDRDGEGDTSESNFNPTDGMTPADTPSRALNPSTGDEAFLQSNKRNFARNYVIEDKENSADDSSSGDNDRQVYGGFKENESDSTSVYMEDAGDYNQRIVQSIERRIGGKHSS